MADRQVCDEQHFPFGTVVTRRLAEVCTNLVPCSSFLCVLAALRDSFSCPQSRRYSTQSRQDAKEAASVGAIQSGHPTPRWRGDFWIGGLDSLGEICDDRFCPVVGRLYNNPTMN